MPSRTPSFFTPFTRRIPAANSGLSSPESAASYSGLIQRVLVIPNKRQSRPLVGFLTRPEIDALLAAPDRDTWLGRRDHTLLLTAIQTGFRLTEITSIRQQDVTLATGAHTATQLLSSLNGTARNRQFAP